MLIDSVSEDNQTTFHTYLQVILVSIAKARTLGVGMGRYQYDSVRRVRRYLITTMFSSEFKFRTIQCRSMFCALEKLLYPLVSVSAVSAVSAKASIGIQAYWQKCGIGPSLAGSKYAKTQWCTSDHWKVGFRSFAMVYDTPILSNIEVSYTVGKLLTSTFQPKCGILCTSYVLSPGVLAQVLVPHDFGILFLLYLGSVHIFGWILRS